MDGPLVSVVIPTFNRAHCLGRAIDSALAQTYPNVEVVVLDDGSTDRTAELMAERYGQETRIKYFKQANQGVTAARNQGLARTTGEFVALLDSDDWWKPWKLEAQLACFRHSPEIGMVWTDMEAVDPQGKVLNRAYLRKMYSCWHFFSMEELFSKQFQMKEVMSPVPEALAETKFYTGDIYGKMFMGSLVHTSTVLLRRERLQQIKGFNEALKLSGEDYDFHFRTCRDGPVGFIDAPSIEYQVGAEDQLTTKKYMIHAVSNCLQTITRAYEEDREKITLPSRMIRRRFGSVHTWLAEVLLDSGQCAQSRREFAKGLWYSPWQPRALKLLPLALLPSQAGDQARAAYRWFKKLAKGSA